VHFVDYQDFEPAACGSVFNGIPELTDFVDTAITCSIDFKHV
jgi:hypothetical protein